MKKIALLLVLIISILSFSACAKQKDNSDEKTQNAETAVTSENEDRDKSGEEESSKQSEKKSSAEKKDESEKGTDGAAGAEKKDYSDKPTVYWATKDRESSDVAYHKKDCPIIKDKEPEELSWEIIDALGMPPCEECKPDSQ